MRQTFFGHPLVAEAAGSGALSTRRRRDAPAAGKFRDTLDTRRIDQNLQTYVAGAWREVRKRDVNPHFKHGKSQRRSTIDNAGSDTIPASAAESASHSV